MKFSLLISKAMGICNEKDKKISTRRKDPEIENPKKPVPYDIIIDITSIKKLNEPGWKIKYKNKDKKEGLNGKKIVVSVLGNSNRGKTYLMQKLSGNSLENGYQIQTKGLSLKFNDDIIYLDTAGTNVPLLVEKDGKRPNEDEIQNVRLCQIITNYLLQKFVIEFADIIICVVGMLNSKEQIFLNKIKKLCENTKKLIVIHNLVKCESSQDIQKYKNDVLFKMITCKLKEKTIPNFNENKKNIFDKYFIEEDNPSVKHFLFANDEQKEGDKRNDDLEKYNKATLNYIRTCIKMERKKNKNLFNSFLAHIKNISSYVLKNEIEPKLEGEDLIKCKEKEIIPREIRADELDNIIFIGKDYEPSHKFYKRGNNFILGIQINSKLEDIEISVEHKLDIGTGETEFKVFGKRKNIPDGEEFLSNKRKNFTNFKLYSKVILKTFDITHISKTEKSRVLKYGTLYYIYPILN